MSEFIIAKGAAGDTAGSVARVRDVVTRRLAHVELIIGLVIVVALALLAIAPGLFTSQNPLQTNYAAVLARPSAAHLLGTDNLGRDTWSRIVYGARASLEAGFGATVISVVVGSAFGVAAGVSGKVGDTILGRIIDVLFAFPSLLLALMAVVMLGTGEVNVMVAIGIADIPGFARIMRGEIFRLRNRPFVKSAIALGVPRRTVLWRHTLPNAVGPLLVLGTVNVGTSIIWISALSFLGLGTAPPQPEWGQMLSDAQLYLGVAPWVAIFPGIFIMLSVLGFGMVGRGLQRINRRGVEG